jgi:hypothetical protein
MLIGANLGIRTNTTPVGAADVRGRAPPRAETLCVPLMVPRKKAQLKRYSGPSLEPETLLPYRHSHKQMLLYVACRERRQITRRWALGDFAGRVKCRSVAFAIERMILFSLQLAFPVSAVRRESNQLISFADHKKSHVTKILV